MPGPLMATVLLCLIVSGHGAPCDQECRDTVCKTGGGSPEACGCPRTCPPVNKPKTRNSWPEHWESTYGPVMNTPCGPRPIACVREAPNQSLIRHPRAGEYGDFILDQGDNLTEVHVPSLCHDFMAEVQQWQVPSRSPSVGAVPNGWVESAGVYYMGDPSVTIHSFKGQWTVPTAPPKPQTPETLYYFIGLEDRTQGSKTTIHQPVLTWGDETEGGKFPGVYSNHFLASLLEGGMMGRRTEGPWKVTGMQMHDRDSYTLGCA